MEREPFEKAVKLAIELLSQKGLIGEELAEEALALAHQYESEYDTQLAAGCQDYIARGYANEVFLVLERELADES